MSLSILPYVGSKRKDIYLFEKYIPKGIKTIVEPFGGSGYLSLYLFSLNPNLKCIVNDNDSNLINFFNQLKKNPQYIINGYNKLLNKKPTKPQFLKLIEEYKNLKSDSSRKAILFLFYNKFCSFRKGLYPLKNNIYPIDIEEHKIFFEWINKTNFYCLDYSEIFSKIINKKNIFVFLDPPYFDSFNGYYLKYDTALKNKNKIIDNTQLYIDILDFIKNAKCNVMLIINKNAITNFIYQKYIIGEYNKIYQQTKNKAQHLIITNY